MDVLYCFIGFIQRLVSQTVSPPHVTWSQWLRARSNVISPVQDVSYESEGFYSCVAGNTLGETISTAYLELAGNIITSERLRSNRNDSLNDFLLFRRIGYQGQCGPASLSDNFGDLQDFDDSDLISIGHFIDIYTRSTVRRINVNLMCFSIFYFTRYNRVKSFLFLTVWKLISVSIK